MMPNHTEFVEPSAAAAEAYELFAVEAARTRLVDRRGIATVTLQCGLLLRGTLAADPACAGMITVNGDSGPMLVRASAVAFIAGTSAHLRSEEASALAPLTLGSWLRERWQTAALLHATLGTAVRFTGRLRLVAADHVEFEQADGTVVVLPLTAVDVWEWVAP